LRLAPALFAFCLLGPAAFAADPAYGEHPLLDLARELDKTRERTSPLGYGAPEVKQAEHALRQADAPPDAECARSLGARNFAGLHVEVGQAREAAGDFTGAADSYRRALACTPRNARIIGALADSLFDARDIPASRRAIIEALDVNPRSVYLTRVAANIDFIEERWADAVSRFRYVAESEPDRNRAAYGQLMYWLAQRRAGVPKPQFVGRRQPEGWPKPLLMYLQGDYTEDELVQPIRSGDDEYANVSTDERLCEALYYVGEAYWASGKPEVARDYFAAMVNLRVIHFIEHGLALAEIAKMRGQ
jgi:lipoprotein NlpI